MKSKTLPIYKHWLATAKAKQIAFVDEVFAMCEANYAAGGDTVVECMSPQDILDEFKSLRDVKKYCGLIVEQATNCRWGEDTDPEIERLRAFEDWE